MNSSPMVISGPQFCLRPLQAGDRDSMAKYANNFNIWINVRNALPHPYKITDAEKFIEWCQLQQPPANLCIEYSGECIGMVGFYPQKDVYCKTADFGYWLGEPFWGKGIMTAAVKLVTQYIFENFDIIRISAGVFSWNFGSIRVLQKAGFTEECVFKNNIFKNGQVIDEHRFCLLKQ